MSMPDEARFRLAAQAILAESAVASNNDDADLDRLAQQIAVLALAAISKPPCPATSDPLAAPPSCEDLRTW
ncbi:hypothetical protein E1218_05025 [Kribbella turkmenica]|uniref:Uncharacterized protein n=1 Tax=Kribbella turkmenica TaxID=2530375 RepID=A0A4R4XEH0_9ACTN|nr:hypothetical protein [Kribbella turkmenica]TDD29231.1 hypothetical protein E1218_05025 [Kribbella turkmenica]